MVMAGGQQMMVVQGQSPAGEHSSPVNSDAALAQLAAEAGLLEGETAEAAGLQEGAEQLDGGYVTPQDGLSELGDPVDIQNYLDIFSSQVDGDPGDPETETETETEDTTQMETEETPDATQTPADTEDQPDPTQPSTEPEPVQSEPEVRDETSEGGGEVPVPEVGEELPVTTSTDTSTVLTTTEATTEAITETSSEATTKVTTEETTENITETTSETVAETTEQEPEPVPETSAQSEPTVSIVKEEEKPLVTSSEQQADTDQADIDGASALAALASAATLTEAILPLSPAPGITSLKSEVGGSVSTQSITSPLTAASAQVTNSPASNNVKNEIEEVM